MNWLQENYKWIFDGIGVAIILIVLKFLFKKKKKSVDSINQTIGKNINSKSGNIDISNNKQEVKK